MASQISESSSGRQPDSHTHSNVAVGPQTITTTQLSFGHPFGMDKQLHSKGATGKASIMSAYPSPEDELLHSITSQSRSSPTTQTPAHDNAGIKLPPIREMLLHPLSPSTSPHISADFGVAMTESHPTYTPMKRTISDNSYTGKATGHDPQLFPEQLSKADDQGPLFIEAKRPLSLPAQRTTKITPRQRKRTPFRSPAPHPRDARAPRVGILASLLRDPNQYYQDRKDELEKYWPSTGRALDDNDLGSDASSPVIAPRTTVGKRTQEARDGEGNAPPAKRQRVQRGEAQDGTRVGTRTSPREAVDADFDELPKEVVKKPRAKAAPKPASAPVQAARKPKQPTDELDTNYTLYKDVTPKVSTLDDPKVSFTANWNGRPLNNDDDPNRGLLHEKEVKLATKLALNCARYLYLKRRFFAGRLQSARKSQVFNINAAQQQCKGQDEHGVTGADVNKTSSLWKAFNSVGWLNESHMQPYLNDAA